MREGKGESILMRDQRKLRAFELAETLVLSIYKVSKSFPKEELLD